MLKHLKHIAIARTDSIGDVVVTLPLLHTIRKEFPDTKISFIGRTYTEPIVTLNKNINQFINWDTTKSLSKKEKIQFLKKQEIDALIAVFPDKEVVKTAFFAEIPIRIGTIGRFHTLLYCNKKVVFSRKNSPLHEAQLNFKLLAPLGLDNIPTIDELAGYYDLKTPNTPLPENFQSILTTHSDKKHIILHPKSQGSAVEWGESNFVKLSKLLTDNDYHVWFTGTEKEADLVPEITQLSHPNIHLTFGQLSLPQLISLINKTNGLVAASTGPLHIAAALDKLAVGLFSPKRPIHPGRWQPIGKNTIVMVHNPDCKTCKENKACSCIQKIPPESVLENIRCFTN